MAARPERAMLPATSGLVASCPSPDDCVDCESKFVEMTGVGTFNTVGTGATPIVAKVGEQFVSVGRFKTVPLHIVSFGGNAYAEGLGETRFWVDSDRPLMSAIWEKAPGTEFPAIQEMRFHFFYSVEAMPGKVFRSINPARMRADDVRSFPPAPGTVYRLMAPVEFEEIGKPGVVAGRILSNRVEIPRPRLEQQFQQFD
jgi:hypothetical protein